MGIETFAYKKVTLDEKGIHFEEDWDDLNARTNNYFKYPNSELYDIAEKFYNVSNGDIDFRYYITYDENMNYYGEENYLEKCKEFYIKLSNIDFIELVKVIEEALDYYDRYELDFTPNIYRDESDREIVEYLLNLAKQKYYIIYEI